MAAPKMCPKCSMRYPASAVVCFFDASQLVETTDERIGTTIAGRYVIEGTLGQGGMATVYEARNKVTGDRVAIKILSQEHLSDPVVLERFRRESKHAQMLSHPNIVEIYDSGQTEDGSVYLAMERLRGKTVAEELGQGPLAIGLALRVMMQTARGLARAHDFGVIHRDIKPENIFLETGDGDQMLVKILDFGIARSPKDPRLTTKGELFGTPAYMSPERIRGTGEGTADDIYALGITFFEMLTGDSPYNGTSPAEIFVKHLTMPVPDLANLAPSAPEGLVELITQMLAKAPKDRPADAHHVENVLTKLAKDVLPSDAPAAAAPVDSKRPADRVLRDPWTEPEAIMQMVLRTVLHESSGASAVARALASTLGQQMDGREKVRLETVRLEALRDDLDAEMRLKRLQLGDKMDELGRLASAARDRQRHYDEAMIAARHELESVRGQYSPLSEAIRVEEGKMASAHAVRRLVDLHKMASDLAEQIAEAQISYAESEERAAAEETVLGDLDDGIQSTRSLLKELGVENEQRRIELGEQMAKAAERVDAVELEVRQAYADLLVECKDLPALHDALRESPAAASVFPPRLSGAGEMIARAAASLAPPKLDGGS